MRIRRALPSEISIVADVATCAFRKDPSYGHFYPWRDQYPEDVRKHLLHKYKTIMVTPGARIMVAELEESDLPENGSDADSGENSVKNSEVGKIVGIATMLRSGGTKEEQDKWNPDSMQKKFQRCILTVLKFVRNLLSPNRAVSQDTIDKFWRDEVEIHESTGKPPNGKLDVLTLAVLPQYQRRGVGERLSDYAASRAIKEAIPIFADASAKGLSMYVANGAKVIGTVVLPETTYKKRFGRQPVKREPLEIPVIRWNAAEVAAERVKLIQSRSKPPE